MIRFYWLMVEATPRTMDAIESYFRPVEIVVDELPYAQYGDQRWSVQIASEALTLPTSMDMFKALPCFSFSWINGLLPHQKDKSVLEDINTFKQFVADYSLTYANKPLSQPALQTQAGSLNTNVTV